MIKDNIVTKEWGYELIFENNELYCGKLIHVGQLWSSGGLYHIHVKKDETFFVLEGTLILDIDGEEQAIFAHDSFRVFPNTPHRFKSAPKIPTCTFIEVSTHHDDEDTIRGTLEALRGAYG